MAPYGDLSEDRLLFIGKSIGTVVACEYAKEKGIDAFQILYSPLAQIEPYVKEERAVLFYADKDPLADYAAIEQIAKAKNLDAFRVEGGNHSLETGDILKDVENLQWMMKELVRYI